MLALRLDDVAAARRAAHDYLLRFPSGPYAGIATEIASPWKSPAGFSVVSWVAVFVIATSAAAAPRVTLVVRPARPAEADQFEARVRSELLASGFEVLTISEPGGTDAGLVEGIVRRTDSVAAILAVQPPDGLAADVSINNRVTGKTLLRHVRPEPLTPDAAGIIAIRAVELLHASLLELAEMHRPRGARPGCRRQKRRQCPPERFHRGWAARAPLPVDPGDPRWSLAAAGAAVGGPGGATNEDRSPASLVVEGCFVLAAGRSFVVAPALGTVSTVSAAGNSTRSCSPCRVPVRGKTTRHCRWAASVSGGGGLYHLGVRGTAERALRCVVGAGMGRHRRHWSEPSPPCDSLHTGSLINRCVSHATAAGAALRRGDAVYAGRPGLAGSLGLEVAW